MTVKAYAQLNVSPTANANSLVNTIVGSGVIVSNVTLNCNPQATAIFSSSGTNLGLSNGIILATGKATEAVGPNNSPGGSIFSAGDGCFNHNASFFDSNLLSFEPEAQYDGCVLEFDIKPVCNTLQIDYVFASEEYPEFVNAGYNDVFGFFIWGPNPAGGSYNGTNIATLPGSSTYVSINNVNGGANGQYYVNNNGGSTIEYDGFTVPLTASANVSQCNTYHLKLAIADAGDCQYSSAVFLANKGITCPANQVPQLSVSNTPLNCGNDGTATVSVINGGGTITYNWQPGGQTTATAVNLAAGTYTCTVGYTLPCPFTQTISTTVSGSNVLTMDGSTQNAYCNNPTGTASVTVSGGTPPYSTPQWNTNPVQNGNSISNLVPGNYTVQVSDATGCTITKTVTVNNTTPNIHADFTTEQSTCHSPNGSITTTAVNGGTAPYSYSWNTTPPATTLSLSNIPSGTYSLTITDIDNCTGTEEVTVTNVDSVLIAIHSINEYCDHGNGEIHVPVLSGMPPYTWTWSQDPTLNDSVATNLTAGAYSFSVTDNAGCTSRGNVTIVDIRDVFNGSIYTLPSEPVVNTYFTLGIDLTSSWLLDYIELDDGSVRSGSNETTLYYPEYGVYDVNFYIESVNGCKDTVPYGIFVKDFMTIYIPNAFTPNNDRRNKVWYVYGTLVKEIKIYVYDRWGMKLFESHDLEQGWDGKFKGELCEEDVYAYKVVAIDYFNEEHKFAGHITLIR
jgi:gliding motility-associated-like protein